MADWLTLGGGVMAVYVDDQRNPVGLMIMCHMLADTTNELLVMADRIGISRRWIQKAGTPHEHFDIARVSRAKAVEAGAVEVTRHEVAAIIKARREGAPVEPATRDLFG